jgi:muramidase (phage lysozyme)
VTSNLAAFLTMISISEGTDRTPEPYRCCYGYKHVIRDLSYHPHQKRPDGTREWAGEPLSDAMCIAAGFPPGCISSAAGRYQINLPSWLEGVKALRLPDFTPPSQDDWTVWKIKSKWALDLVNAGRIAEALATPLHSVWASLPGPKIDQPQRDVAFLLNAYSQSGGGFA